MVTLAPATAEAVAMSVAERWAPATAKEAAAMSVAERLDVDRKHKQKLTIRRDGGCQSWEWRQIFHIQKSCINLFNFDVIGHKRGSVGACRGGGNVGS